MCTNVRTHCILSIKHHNSKVGFYRYRIQILNFQPNQFHLAKKYLSILDFLAIFVTILTALCFLAEKISPCQNLSIFVHELVWPQHSLNQKVDLSWQSSLGKFFSIANLQTNLNLVKQFSLFTKWFHAYHPSMLTIQMLFFWSKCCNHMFII